MRSTSLLHRGIVILTFLSAPLLAQVKITYLANEGVQIEASGAKVLVDALFRDSLGDYGRHSAETQERLESGKSPHDGVVLALATHYHLDHWDAGAISRFLRQNPQASFGSTPTGVAMMPSELRKQVRSVWPENGGKAELTVAGIRVEGLPLEHGSTQNLGWRISLGDRVVMHLGDASANSANFARLQSIAPPNVLLVPFWWLLDPKGVEFLTQRWKPGRIVALHFGADDVAKSTAKVRSSVADVWVCTRAGESREY